jgi:hypothetical protein
MQMRMIRSIGHFAQNGSGFTAAAIPQARCAALRCRTRSQCPGRSRAVPAARSRFRLVADDVGPRDRAASYSSRATGPSAAVERTVMRTREVGKGRQTFEHSQRHPPSAHDVQSLHDVTWSSFLRRGARQSVIGARDGLVADTRRTNAIPMPATARAQRVVGKPRLFGRVALVWQAAPVPR